MLMTPLLPLDLISSTPEKWTTGACIMNKFDTATIALLGVLLGVSLYTDLRFGKVYNKLTLPCILLGIVLNALLHGLQGALLSIEGAVLIMVLFLLFAPVTGIGGGDAKLMMAVGALLGFKIVVGVLLYTAIAGGVIALIVLARQRALLSTANRVVSGMYMSIFMRAPIALIAPASSTKFRYSPAIAIGTLAACLLNR